MNKDTTQIFMTELDTYLFGQGTHYEIYNKMGAHLAVKNGKEGCMGTKGKRSLCCR